jgi:hypothetical protein
MAKLTVVGPDHQPELVQPAASLVAACEMDERAMLVKMRLDIAAAIDAGVPPHTLASLMTKLRETDRDIRAFDVRAAADESSRSSEVEDGRFDASAV